MNYPQRNVENILKLADEIEGDGERFNMETCETCLIGYSYACQFGYLPSERELDEYSSCELLAFVGCGTGDTSEDHVTRGMLYLADGRRTGLPLEDITRSHAARMLRKLAAEGAIDWLTTENA